MRSLLLWSGCMMGHVSCLACRLKQKRKQLSSSGPAVNVTAAWSRLSPWQVWRQVQRAAGRWFVAGSTQAAPGGGSNRCCLLIVGCWLLIADRYSLDADYWLLIADCRLLIAGCWLLATGYWLLAASR